MEIEEVGTNWKTRPNQATPTIQGYQSGQTHILMTRQRIIIISNKSLIAGIGRD